MDWSCLLNFGDILIFFSVFFCISRCKYKSIGNYGFVSQLWKTLGKMNEEENV